MNNNRIKELPESLVNLIRAGEVIVRPASVLRELVSNSIDAKATSIDVVISHSCRDLSVIDNGSGIISDDLPLALMKHATSKFKNFDTIDTYGFRGEALSSIKDVAHIKIISRILGETASVINNDCEIIPSSFGGGAHGTMVYVEDLFHSHPPRLKHLRIPAKENKACLDVFNSYAMANHFIRMTYERKSNSRTAKIYYPSDTMEGRYKKITGASDYICISGKHENLSLDGYISFDSEHEFLSVNSRPVDMNTAIKTIKDHLSKRIGRPVKGVTCNIKASFSDVDVNIHPEKLNVRVKGLGDNIIALLEDALIDFKVDKEPEDFSGIAKSVLLEGDNGTGILGRVVHIIDNMYAVSDDGDGMILIDLHAGHERVIMERMIRDIKTQTVSLNEFIPLSVSEVNNVIFKKQELSLFGFIFEEDAGGLIVTQKPGLVSDLESFFQDVARDKSDIYKSVSLYACHNAFRRKEITLQEADNIVRSIETYGLGSFCNHGRPVWIRLKSNGIAKLFHRS